MNSRMKHLLTVAMGLLIATATQLSAADPKPTTISIPGMHCAGCAKKVTDKLNTVVGVAKAEADMKTKTIKVTSKPNKAFSPKDLWEAVEKADQTPTKLEGPNGTFTEKPKS